MTFKKCSQHKITGKFRGRKKCYKFCVIKVLEATDRYTDWKLVDKVEKLNINKHWFCVKKGKVWNIF